jgi:ADP-ribose pyrophosphatase YjhB (NUDIX family)
MTEKFTMRVAVHLILIKDDQILLLRRCNTPWRNGWYSVIAGHVDGNETIAHAMAREALEEGGLTIQEDDLRIVHVLHRTSNFEFIDYFFVPEKYSGVPKNMEPEKCDDLSWFPIDALPENTIPYIRHAMERIRTGVVFSEFDERKLT